MSWFLRNEQKQVYREWKLEEIFKLFKPQWAGLLESRLTLTQGYMLTEALRFLV